MTALQFDPARMPTVCQTLREDVRAFLAREIAAGTFDPDRPTIGSKNVVDFAKCVGAQGWIGMTWPKQYGGQERSFLERYVVTEVMRIANAPVRRFFVADGQSGPTLIRYASDKVKKSILPRIVGGDLCFCIGMTEPGSGSDLFAARAKGTRTESG